MKEGKTVLYATHNIGSVPKICNKAILLHEGAFMGIGEPEQIINQYVELSKKIK